MREGRLEVNHPPSKMLVTVLATLNLCFLLERCVITVSTQGCVLPIGSLEVFPRVKFTQLGYHAGFVGPWSGAVGLHGSCEFLLGAGWFVGVSCGSEGGETLAVLALADVEPCPTLVAFSAVRVLGALESTGGAVGSPAVP